MRRQNGHWKSVKSTTVTSPFGVRAISSRTAPGRVGAQETALAHKRRDDYVSDLEVAQLLDAKNARRLRKGQPPLSLEDYTRQIRGSL